MPDNDTTDFLLWLHKLVIDGTTKPSWPSRDGVILHQIRRLDQQDQTFWQCLLTTTLFKIAATQAFNFTYHHPEVAMWLKWGPGVHPTGECGIPESFADCEPATFYLAIRETDILPGFHFRLPLMTVEREDGNRTLTTWIKTTVVDSRDLLFEAEVKDSRCSSDSEICDDAIECSQVGSEGIIMKNRAAARILCDDQALTTQVLSLIAERSDVLRFRFRIVASKGKRASVDVSVDTDETAEDEGGIFCRSSEETSYEEDDSAGWVPSEVLNQKKCFLPDVPRCGCSDCFKPDRIINDNDSKIEIECSKRCKFIQHAVCFRKKLKVYHTLIESRICVTPDCNGRLLRATILDTDGVPIKKYVNYKEALEQFRQEQTAIQNERRKNKGVELSRSVQKWQKSPYTSAQQREMKRPDVKLANKMKGKEKRPTQRYLATLITQLQGSWQGAASTGATLPRPDVSGEVKREEGGDKGKLSKEQASTCANPQECGDHRGGRGDRLSPSKMPSESVVGEKNVKGATIPSAPCFLPPCPVLLLLLNGALAPSELRLMPELREMAAGRLESMLDSGRDGVECEEVVVDKLQQAYITEDEGLLRGGSSSLSSSSTGGGSLNPEAAPFVPKTLQNQESERRDLLPDISVEILSESRRSMEMVVADNVGVERCGEGVRGQLLPTQQCHPAVASLSADGNDGSQKAEEEECSLRRSHVRGKSAVVHVVAENSGRSSQAAGGGEGSQAGVSSLSSSESSSLSSSAVAAGQRKFHYDARVLPVYRKRVQTFRQLWLRADSLVRQQRKEESISLQQLAAASFVSQPPCRRRPEVGLNFAHQRLNKMNFGRPQEVVRRPCLSVMSRQPVPYWVQGSRPPPLSCPDAGGCHYAWVESSVDKRRGGFDRSPMLTEEDDFPI